MQALYFPLFYIWEKLEPWNLEACIKEEKASNNESSRRSVNIWMFCRRASGRQGSAGLCWTWSLLLTLPDLHSALRTKQPAWTFSSRACFLLSAPSLLRLDFLWDAVAFKASCWGPRPKPKPHTDADLTNRSFPTPAGPTGSYCVGNQNGKKNSRLVLDCNVVCGFHHGRKSSASFTSSVFYRNVVRVQFQ